MSRYKPLPGESVLSEDEEAEMRRIAREEARAATRYCRECGNLGYHHPHCPAVEDEDYDDDDDSED
ncbi:MAG: hypothetical protein KGI71_06680 [Patescibacteria group bacterium]|nr:hypothetical protein [Patescibacteria group bacterium]